MEKVLENRTNRGDYKITINGKGTPQYVTWYGMMRRCNDGKYQKRQPSYIGCTVSEEWQDFQVFAKWYDENYYEIDGERTELDKDILVKGNRVYSPETCMIVPKKINGMFIKRDAKRGSSPIGTHFVEGLNKYKAYCSNGFKVINLGLYDTPEEAFEAYKTFKEALIKEVANEYRGRIPVKLYDALINYKVEIDD